MGTFHMPSWPYDPSSVGREAWQAALGDLIDVVNDGIHQVERAVGALQVSTSMVQSKAGELATNGENLAKIDRTGRDVRRLLEDAMDLVYRAASDVDRL